ncbi:MAG: enoyl-CoA hydratase [Salinarimonadaceae bacterium]|nr:MAG: enoyl-CoA hydratase [Salinarimonadaceae bacterium]
MTTKPEIRIAIADGAARLTIANPDRKNAMNFAMWRALPELVGRCEIDTSVRAIVLTGEGDAFCAGADISEFGDKRSDEAGARAYEEAVSAANAALRNAAKPMIALIRGVCYGGGVGLALACDLRIARDDARFRIPAARLGLGYSLDNVALVASRIGAAATADLLFSARVFDAGQAQRDGLVREVFASAEFDAATDAYIARIAENAPLTLLAVKAALVELAKPEAERDEARVTATVMACMASEDYAEGRKAFGERREPRFQGK